HRLALFQSASAVDLLVLADTYFFSSRRRHTRSYGDWSSDVCSSDLISRPSRSRGWLAGPGRPGYPGGRPGPAAHRGRARLEAGGEPDPGVLPGIRRAPARAAVGIAAGAGRPAWLRLGGTRPGYPAL